MDIISNILKMVSAYDTSLGVSVSHLFLFSLLVSCDILSDRRDLVIDKRLYLRLENMYKKNSFTSR